ncbi:MAG: hypothetical protein WB626_01970 [Bacteroidota bacterium]
MSFSARSVRYYTATARDQPGEGFKLLSGLAAQGVNLMAFTAVPTGTMTTVLTLFPEDPAQLEHAARMAGVGMTGPHGAILVQGDDRLGAFAGIHERLFRAGVNVYASSGVTDGRGGFGYVLYLRPDDCARAEEALKSPA